VYSNALDITLPVLLLDSSCRNVAAENQVSLSNVSLIIPPLEAAQLAAAAVAAVQAADGSKGEAAVLSMVYPTPAGPLPVVYRSLVIANSTEIAGEHGAAAADVQRRRLSAASGGNAGQQTICIGSLQGLGLLGRNVCMIAASDDFPLPPGYVWPGAASSSGSSSSWQSWQQALVALAVSLPVLAAALLGAVCMSRRKKALHLVKHQQDAPGKQRNGSNTSSTAPSDLGYMGGPATTGSCSSENLKAYSAVLAQRMRELCPGGADSSTAATAGSPLPLFASSSNPALSLQMAANVQQQQQQQAAGDRTVVVVEAGERRLSLEDAAAAPAAAAAWTAEQSQQQKWAAKQQQQDAGGVVQRLAGAISTVSAEMHARRLSGFQATSGSGKWQSATPNSMSRKNSPSSGSGGGAADAAATAAAKSGAAKQELQQRVRGLSIDEDHAADQQQYDQQEQQQQQQQQVQQQQQMLGLSEITPAAAAVAAGDQQCREDPQALAPAAAVTAAGSAVGESPRSQTGRHAGSSLGVTPTQEMQQLHLHDVIGSGSFGVVYRATWRGVPAAVKVLQLPAAAGGSLGLGSGEGKAAAAAGRREQMAVMETALGASIHHPNIVQVGQ
jgi:hypothetical protein